MAAKGSSATIIFDDGQGDLGPLSDLRACFEQRTGGHTLLERARAHGMADALAVPAAMAPMLAARHGCAVNDAVADGRLDVTPTFAAEMSYCLGCLACQTACPAGVDYATLLENARGEVERQHVVGVPTALKRTLTSDSNPA